MTEFDKLGEITSQYCRCSRVFGENPPAINMKNYCCEECGKLVHFAGITVDVPIAYYDGPHPSKTIEAHNFRQADSRPEWDTYFITMAFLVSQRSLDKHTKHGCILVGNDRAILSTGYNGPPRAYPDHLVDLERPGKYVFMEHSERNAIANAARIGIPLQGAIAYITGMPCNECYRMLWQAGIRSIIYAPIGLGPQYDTDHLSKKEKVGPTLIPFNKQQCESVLHLLSQTSSYFSQRVEVTTT